MAEKRVIVYRTSDPIQADMLGALLRENGIAACVLGTRHGAAIGVGQHILDLHIEVPYAQAGTAADFLEAFFESDGSALLAEHAGFEPDLGDPDGDGDARAEPHPAATPGTRPLAAGLAALALLGGSHFYARRPVTALMLAAGQLAAIALAFVACAAPPVHGAVVVASLLGLDFLGGQVAVRARRRGVHASAARQLATGTVFVALAATLGALFAPPSGSSSSRRPVPAARPAH
jgi:hypothetical protein